MFKRLKSKTKIVNKCWEWQGTTKGFGYGSTTIGSRTDGSRKTISTHRAMMIAVHGGIPKDAWVLHNCDNPKCINPKHLYFGDRKQNVIDREARGRNVIPNLRHENHPRAILNWGKVKKIRSMKNLTQEKIAKMFGVSRSAIKDVLNFYTWVPKPPKDSND